MSKNGNPRCLWCGAELREAVWNEELNVLYCVASGCEKLRHPQMKRYKSEEDPAGGLWSRSGSGRPPEQLGNEPAGNG